MWRIYHKFNTDIPSHFPYTNSSISSISSNSPNEVGLPLPPAAGHLRVKPALEQGVHQGSSRERCTRYLHGTDGMSSIHTASALGNGGMLINSSRQKWNKVKCQRLSCRLLVTFPKTLQVCWLLVSTTTERASLSYKIYVE